jgi:hypothetical protein
VVESGAKNIEVAVQRFGQPLAMLPDSQVDVLVTAIEAEKEASGEKKKENTRDDSGRPTHVMLEQD